MTVKGKRRHHVVTVKMKMLYQDPVKTITIYDVVVTEERVGGPGLGV